MSYRVCAAGGANLESDEYTKSQWRKGNGASKCMACVTGGDCGGGDGGYSSSDDGDCGGGDYSSYDDCLDLVAIVHTRRTQDCGCAKAQIDLSDYDACQCYHGDSDDDDDDYYQCDGNYNQGNNFQCRAHVHEELDDGSMRWWLTPACKKCNAQHGAKMYVDRSELFPLPCDCPFKDFQTAMKGKMTYKRKKKK